jgi:LCP family protein required for cell wall assembly
MKGSWPILAIAVALVTLAPRTAWSEPLSPLASGALVVAGEAQEPGWSYRLRLQRLLSAAEAAADQDAAQADALPASAEGPAPAQLTPTLGYGGAPAAPALSGVAARLSGLAPSAFATPLPELNEDILNVLIAGSDRRPGAGNWRTDTLVLVSIDKAQRKVGMLSVPRDLWVNIPGHGQGRVNTADFLGVLDGRPDGELMKETVAGNLGVPVHRFIRVNFKAFVSVVDALGGLDLVVDCPLEDYFLGDGASGPGEVSLQTGLQHVDGATALRYARSRHSTSDFDRSRRQQRVLRAMAARAREKGLLRSAPRILASVREHVQTDLNLAELLALGVLAARVSDLSVRSGQLDFHQLANWTTPEGAQVLLADPAAVSSKLDEVLTVEPSAATAPTRVALVDHTGRPGWGQVAGLRLGEHQLAVSPTRTGAAEDGSVIYYKPSGEATARAALTALGLDETALAPMDTLAPAMRLSGDVQVVLGADWAPRCP